MVHGTMEPAWEPGKGSWEPGKKGGREEPGYLGREAKRKDSLYNGCPYNGSMLGTDRNGYKKNQHTYHMYHMAYYLYM